MGSNHMNDHFNGKKGKKNKKVTKPKTKKFEIPTHDPQTGELNPYYEELTGKKNPLSQSGKTDT